MPKGIDISEHQASFPNEPGVEFVIIRVLNENGREDRRWRDHYDEANARGLAVGAYGIVQPGRIDPVEYAQRYLALLRERVWHIVPTVDVELGDPAENRPYCEAVNSVLRSQYPKLMGYYSAASAYRHATQHLYDFHWLASWGSRLPADADVHQYQGHPLDLNYAPSLEPIRLGVPSEEDDLPYSQQALEMIFVDAAAKAFADEKYVLKHVELLLNVLNSEPGQAALRRAVAAEDKHGR